MERCYTVKGSAALAVLAKGRFSFLNLIGADGRTLGSSTSGLTAKCVRLFVWTLTNYPPSPV